MIDQMGKEKAKEASPELAARILFCLYAGRTFIESSPGEVNNDPIKMAVAAGKIELFEIKS